MSAPIGAAVSPLASVPIAVHWSIQSIAYANGGPTLLGTKSPDGGKSPDCLEVSVRLAGLHLGKAEPYPCADNPGADGGAYPVVTITKTFDAAVRIARTDATTGQTTLGPVVMSFGQYSTSRLVSTSGYGSLWLYDVGTPSGAELLRVSSVTGTVDNRVLFPDRPIRPILAADADGLWMGISPCGASGGTRSPIYFVPNGADHATIAWRGGNSVLWAVPDRGHVWFEVFYASSGQGRLLRFDGASNRATLDVPLTGSAASWLTEEEVIGNSSVGFWTLGWSPDGDQGSSCAEPTILHIDPLTGRVGRVTTLPVPSGDLYGGCNGLDTGQALIFENHFLLLMRTASEVGTGAYTTLYSLQIRTP